MWKKFLVLPGLISMGLALVGCAPPLGGPGGNAQPVPSVEDVGPEEPAPDDSGASQPEPPEIDLTGTRSFKLRIGQNAKHADDFIVGGRAETDTVNVPFLVRRFRGEGTQTVNLTYEILEGDPAGWSFVPPADSVALGPGPTQSSADFDFDGDVDDGDRAEFDACFSGAGNVYPLAVGCQLFDFDGDHDVDAADEKTFQAAYTGTPATPARYDLRLPVTAHADTPEEAALRLRITGTDPETGETNSVYAHVVKRSFGINIELLNHTDFTTERGAKVTVGDPVYFDMGVTLTGANPDVIRLVPGQIADPAGFLVQPLSSSGAPLSEFTLAPADFDRTIFHAEGFADILEGWPASGRRLRLAVAPPPDWPVRSQQTVSLEALGLVSGVSSQVSVEVTKVPAIWTPSDLFSPAGRRHLVRPGSRTTFVLLVKNPFDQQTTFTLIPTKVGPSPGWTFELSRYLLPLEPGQQFEVVATLTAPPDAAIGQTVDWNVTLTTLDGFANLVRVGAEVTNTRKIYLVAVDGLQPDYMYLDANGTGPGSPGDWLMPNVQDFISISSNYTNSKCSLPAVTDSNHVNALCGTHTGTSGVPSVFYYYTGVDEEGTSVAIPGDASLLRYGPNGETVLSAFDVARQVNPRAFTAMACGKNWIADFFVKEQGGVDLVLSGRGWPFYHAGPEPYFLGDPPTDADPEDPDRLADFANWGDAPGLFPDDQWVLHGALRVIAYEDPDVLYILLAHTDDAQHQMGAAWDPAEWNDQGTATAWDDTNRVNPLAQREDVLDVVREVDHLFGELIELLRSRGTLEESYIALLADHGFVTQTPATIDLRKILERAGYSYKDDFDVYAGAGYALIYRVAPEKEAAIETLLETAPSITVGEDHNPWVILNREEMKTGVDAFSNVRVAEPGELYSEFYAEHEVPTTDRQRWPSFYVFLEGHHPTAFMFVQAGEEVDYERLFTGGHAGPASQRIPTVMFGPGIGRGQVYTEPVSIADIVPTFYYLQGWPAPPSTDGVVLPGIADAP